MRAKTVSLCKSVATALFVLTGSIAVPLLVRPFYWMHIGPLHLTQHSGLSAGEIRQIYAQMMDYCLGLRSEFSVGTLPFSAEGASHFADVRALFLLDLAVLVCSAAAMLLLGFYCRYKAVQPHRFMGHGPAFWGCVNLGVLFALIGGTAALDFNRAFTVFHAVFFPGKDNWLFDPVTDPIIILLPQTFFRNCGILILAALLLCCTTLILRDIYLMHTNK